MSKQKTVFVCQSCGNKTVQWAGKCQACSTWNSIVEEIIPATNTHFKVKPASITSSAIEIIDQFDVEESKRYVTYDAELNRVLGGGIVPGSLVLVGGEPGIGKSTLLLQLALSARKLKILYVSGEESSNQIKLRAQRIGKPNPLLHLFTETEFGEIVAAINEVEPQLIIIDSIQTIYKSEIESTPGTVPQIRECTSHLMQIAKKKEVSIFLVGHITKEGSIAGPKLLEHMVDCVLYFEGDRNYQYRILRTVKNRFGSTAEIGIYEMKGGGLYGIENPSAIFLGNHLDNLSGIAIGATMEGARPILVEIQALVSPTQYGTAQRSSTGFDTRRLSMLLAVLEKRCGLKLAMQDVFLNVTGGMKIADPAMDLAVVAAIASSYLDTPIGQGICFAGEVGLSGEIRTPSHLDIRVKEIKRMGFKALYTSDWSEAEDSQSRAYVNKISTVMAMIMQLFK